MPPKFSNGLLDPKSTLRKHPADFCLTKVQRRAGGEFREREGTLLELSRGLLAPRGILGSRSLELGASQSELGGVIRSSYGLSFRRVLISLGAMQLSFRRVLISFGAMHLSFRRVLISFGAMHLSFRRVLICICTILCHLGSF
jgi:hypothetical protein